MRPCDNFVSGITTFIQADDGKHVEIKCEEPQLYQLDGDPPPVADNSETENQQSITQLDIKVLQAVLPVLVP